MSARVVKGQEYTSSLGWKCVTESGVSTRGFVLVRWKTGPLVGREGRVEARDLR